MGNYTEWYAYDGVGNILEMRHHTASGGWRRCYQYAMDSNRLLSTSGPGELQGANDTCPTPYKAISIYSERYIYDLHGNMTEMPHLELMIWDCEDQLRATRKQAVEPQSGLGETTYYVYDVTGERVRKVTEHAARPGELARRKAERVYLDGYEIYLDYNGNGEDLKLRRATLHIMDEEQRIALVETKTHDDGLVIPESSSLTRYQMDNHLDSASLELDGGGDIISYEEYHPYGTAAYQAAKTRAKVSCKRYRYTGSERDEESGLYCNGIRLYVPWIARWTSCDPLVWEHIPLDLNAYAYAGNRPTRFVDKTGLAECDTSNVNVSRAIKQQNYQQTC